MILTYLKDWSSEESEWLKLEAYKISLAIDLRRVLDEKYVVYVWDEELNERTEIIER